jgi:hypothetical protein
MGILKECPINGHSKRVSDKWAFLKEENLIFIFIQKVNPSFNIGNLNFSWSEEGFEQPCLSDDFDRRLNDKKVLLESVHAKNTSINGIVRVLNDNFYKQVKIRYTLDNWSSFNDLDCHYYKEPIPINGNGSGHHKYDRFKFSLNLEDDFILSLVDQNHIIDPFFSFQFSICYKSVPHLTSPSCDVDFNQIQGTWDNNNGENYKIKCEFKLLSIKEDC